jgi:hypothetical protein
MLAYHWAPQLSLSVTVHQKGVNRGRQRMSATSTNHQHLRACRTVVLQRIAAWL